MRVAAAQRLGGGSARRQWRGGTCALGGSDWASSGSSGQRVAVARWRRLPCHTGLHRDGQALLAALSELPGGLDTGGALGLWSNGDREWGLRGDRRRSRQVRCPQRRGREELQLLLCARGAIKVKEEDRRRGECMRPSAGAAAGSGCAQLVVDQREPHSQRRLLRAGVAVPRRGGEGERVLPERDGPPPRATRTIAHLDVEVGA